MVDIGTSQEAIDLQATITAAPDDVAPQLVLADLLLSADDPRGELIMLDRRERDGDLVDPDAIERLLELAAVYGFPRAEPEDPPLPFAAESSGGYVLRHQARIDQVRYRNGRVVHHVNYSPIGGWDVELASRDRWTPDEAAPIVRAIGDAIRAGTSIKDLRLPFERHPLPQYEGAAIRCYEVPRKFAIRRGVPPTAYGLAARDYRRWMALWGTCGRIRAALRDADQL